MKQQPSWPSISRWSILTLGVLVLAAILRLWQLGILPPAPYWEEVALGYDAYSLLQTGRDHHGNAWPVIAFESFGDWKPSGYFYALLPSLQLFGLTVWAIRLPSALAGIGIVGLLPYLVEIIIDRKLTNLEKNLTRLLAALCPWLLVFARGGWEVNLATFTLLAGSLYWWQSITAPKVTFATFCKTLAAVSLFAISMYTYHAMRLIVPLWGIGLLIFAMQVKWQLKTWLKYLGLGIFSLVIGVLLTLPILVNLNQKVVNQRFQETSIFADPTPVLQSNELRERFGYVWWANLLYHRYWFYTKMVVTKLTEHLSVSFLFVSGDPNARHRSALYGNLLYPDLILIGFGLYWLSTQKNYRLGLIIWLWLASTIPAALTTATPHALRTLPAALIWLVVAGIGTFYLIERVLAFKSIFPKWVNKMVLIGMLGIYLSFGFAWWRTYSHIYPQVFAQDWQYGYAQMIETVQALAKNNPEAPITISRQQGRPAMYWWFYTKTDPTEVQSVAPIVPKDQGEFLQFKNLTFSRLSSDFEPNSIVAFSETEWVNLQKDHPTWTLEEMSIIRLPNHQPVWLVGILRNT